jgi:solute carrier family 25 thiamine pyrophosphate transporter 19
MQYFTCGLLAGLLAKLSTHPLDVAKKRYQVAGLQRSLKYGARVEKGRVTKSLSTCLAEIYRQEGMRGLWKGSVPSIIKAAPNAALTFVAYEVFIAFLLAAQERTGQQQQQQQQQQQR